MITIEKALGFSLLLHVAICILIVTVKIPEHTTSRAQFEAWVKDIAPAPRQATFVPKPVRIELTPTPEEAKPEALAPEAAPAKASHQAAPTRTAGPVSTARSNTLRSKGILGVIGSSSNSVFESNNLESAAVGTQQAESSSGSNISRQALKASSSNQASQGPADIGQVASASSGKVQAGTHQQASILAPKVSTSSGSFLSGKGDQNSLMSVITRKNSSFTRCYERSLKDNPNLAGRIGYEISVSTEGHVLDVRFTENTIRSSEVLECIKAILMRLTFPPLNGPVIFSSVLVLGTS